jgi:sugar phosphate isomerase/epimerase
MNIYKENDGMSDRIALQLYSVREPAGKDYEDTVRKVAAMGYRAVETAGFPGTTAEKAKQLFTELNMRVVAAHSAMPLGEKKNEVLETMEALGKPLLICPSVPKDELKTNASVLKLCDTFNEANAIAQANGLRFGFHNHWAEYAKTEEGSYVYQLFMEHMDPAIFFELDTYWIQVAGCDPVKIIKMMGKRAPLLHIKDGPGVREAAMTAVGDGVIDVPAILKAGGDNAEWWIVELDRCDTDIMEAVRKSYTYLKGYSS